jgi:hypothetical protein
VIVRLGQRPFIAVEMRGNVNEPDLALYVVTNPEGSVNDSAQARLPDEDAMAELMIQALEQVIGVWRKEHPRGAH